MKDAASLRIHQMTWEAEGVLSLVLRDPGGHSLLAWEPGAHIDVELFPGLTRQYSLCGSPSESFQWRIAVLREEQSKGGSQYVHTALRPGMLVTVHGPRNNFPLQHLQNYLFIAGGIGITPMLPMLSSVSGRGANWRLLYGGRHRRSMAFLHELAAFGEHVTVAPEDECGLLDLASEISSVSEDTAVYCCGPESLISAVEVTCRRTNHHDLHVERFRPDPESAPQFSADSNTAFQVQLQRSRKTLFVPPDRSILEIVQSAGVDVVSSCLEGYCGSCETVVLEGDIDHRDIYLPDEDRLSGKTMMICVSRSNESMLVLDL